MDTHWQRPGPGIARRISIVALGLAALGPARPAHAAASTTGPAASWAWRTPEHDGLNSLFLQLRTLGYSSRYDAYVDGVRRRRNPGRLDRLDGLVAAARDLGFALTPARLTFADLEAMPAPVTGYFEREDDGTGYFALIVQVDKDVVYLIHGGSASADVVPRDRFRREWSGLALVPVRQSDSGGFARRLSTALIAGWTAFVVICRIPRLR